MNLVSPVLDQSMNRRSFLGRMGAGIATVGAAKLGIGTVQAEDKPNPFAAISTNSSSNDGTQISQIHTAERAPEKIPIEERAELAKTFDGLIEYAQRRLVMKTRSDFIQEQDFDKYMSNIKKRYETLGHNGFNTYIANLDRLRNNEPDVLNDTDVDLYNRTTDMLMPPKFLAKLQTEVEREVDINNIHDRANAYMVHMKQRPFIQVSQVILREPFKPNTLTAFKEQGK